MRGYPYHSLFRFYFKDIQDLPGVASENVMKMISECHRLQEIGVNFCKFSWGSNLSNLARFFVLKGQGQDRPTAIEEDPQTLGPTFDAEFYSDKHIKHDMLRLGRLRDYGARGGGRRVRDCATLIHQCHNHLSLNKGPMRKTQKVQLQRRRIQQFSKSIINIIISYNKRIFI